MEPRDGRDEASVRAGVTGYREHAISGVKWTGGSTGIGMAIQFVQMAVLARYLTTEDFGLFGEAMVVVGIALAFVDLGLSPALVQRQETDTATISSLFWLVACISGATGLLVWSSSGFVAAFFEAPHLVEVIFPAAAFVVVFGIGQVPLAVLQKALAFDRLSKVDIVSGVLGAVTAILCAADGFGARAPMIGLLVSGSARLLGLLFYVRMIWWPGLHFQVGEARSFVSFGAYQTGERFVNYLAANLDFVMIGRYLGPAALGPYYVAYQVVVQPMMRLNPVLTRVAFPVFSRIQSDDAVIVRGYVRIIKLVGLVALPLLIGMAVVAPSFFRVYLGNAWSEEDLRLTITLAQILVPVSILKCLANPLGSAFLAKGRPDIGFSLNTGRLVLNALLFWLAIQSGPQAVALAYVASSLLAFWAGHLALRRVMPLGMAAVTKAVMRSLFSATLMGIVVAMTQLVLTGARIDPLHKLLFLVSLGGTVYFVATFRLERTFLQDIRGWIARRQEDR